MFKKLFCKHEYLQFIENLYGDRINLFSTKKKIYRSVWSCENCKKIIFKEHLKQKDKWNIDDWIKNKYKDTLDDMFNDWNNEPPLKYINNLDDLILYLEWNYKQMVDVEKHINHKLACELINYKNYQSNIEYE